MNILELDEAQGLTPEMVRAWLRKNDWALSPETHWWRYTKQEGSGAFEDEDVEYNLHLVLKEAVAPIMGLGWQAVLRAINPRMRKGWPSQAAIDTHGQEADWLLKDEDGALRSGYFSDGFFRYDNDHGEVWLTESSCGGSFWPADDYGNKVRWPTDEQGAML